MENMSANSSLNTPGYTVDNPDHLSWWRDKVRKLARQSNIAADTRVAIGVVTYNNSERELKNSLASAEISLKSAGFGAQGAMFIIDNGACSKKHTNGMDVLTRIESRGNVGFGTGHNILMKEAFNSGYELYITVQPDGLLHYDATRALVKSVKASKGNAVVEALQFPAEHPKPYDTVSFETPWVSGTCVAIPKKVFDDLGGFDEDFFMYFEDVDFSWRARALGFTLKMCPFALYLHQVTNREMNPEQLQMVFESGLTLARIWGSPEFENWLKDELMKLGKPIPSKVSKGVSETWRSIADFSHQFNFAQPRW